jgi:hypothetical protein
VSLAFAELSKCQESPLLNGLLDSNSPASHANIFKRVTDAKQQLVDLQKLVGSMMMHLPVLCSIQAAWQIYKLLVLSRNNFLLCKLCHSAA